MVKGNVPTSAWSRVVSRGRELLPLGSRSPFEDLDSHQRHAGWSSHFVSTLTGCAATWFEERLSPAFFAASAC
jgi:hypothetical protein